MLEMQLGNPETNDAEDWKGLIDYAWSHAVVSDETHKIIRENCDFNSNNTWSNEDCSQAVDEVLAQYSEIDIYSLYTSVCITNSAYADNKAMQAVFKKSSSKMVCAYTLLPQNMSCALIFFMQLRKIINFLISSTIF
ncbi:putative carboxypeptidase D [Helianthus annuus]|nr:putative carboxypeptidase D [Helianthus annuus]